MTRRQQRTTKAPSPGRILQGQLDDRGWSQTDLAVVMGRPVQLVNEIVNGKKSITPQTAMELAAAMWGESAESIAHAAAQWLRVQSLHQLEYAHLTPERLRGIRGRAKAMTQIARTGVRTAEERLRVARARRTILGVLEEP